MGVALDVAYKFGAGRYIQEPNALDLAGGEIARFGKRALILGGPTAIRIVRERLSRGLRKYGVQYEFSEYRGYTTYERARAYGNYCAEKGFSVVVGVGGGRIMDLAKAAAHCAGLPVVNIPTQAGTCAAYTPMSVMYTPEGGALGTAEGNFYHSTEVAAVIVDENIMVYQPPRYAASGVLDAMAKFIEVQNGRPQMDFDQLNIGLYTAYHLAKYTYEILDRTCLKVFDDIEHHRLTKEVHDFLFINFAVTGIISGISKALGQAALAHDMYYAVRLMFTRESQGYLHGEIVGAALALQLWYNRTPEKISGFRTFMKQMGMPLTLASLGIPETEENLERIFEYLKGTLSVDPTPDNLKRLREGILQLCEASM